ESDMSKVPAKVVRNDRLISVVQDFSGGLGEAQITVLAQSVIHNIASFEYHLNGWAAHNGKSIQKVKEMFRASLPLRIIHDLWDNDKHVTSRQGHSGLSPRLEHVRRHARLTTKAKKALRCS